MLRLFLAPTMPLLPQQALEIDTLRSLDWKTQRPVPDKLCEWSKTSADAENGCVVQRLLESVMVEENS